MLSWLCIKNVYQYAKSSSSLCNPVKICVFLCVDAAFKNTGLERANNLAKDLEWFKEQGYELPEPKAHCETYSLYLKDIAENDPPAFICHFYNIYFGHSAGGGRMIGSKVIKKKTIH